MRIFRPIVLLTISISTLLVLPAQAQSSGGEQGMSLGEIARQNRRNKAAADANQSEAKKAVDPASSQKVESDDPQFNPLQLLVDGKFEALDKAAALARSSKARAPGGVWKLYLFYEAVTVPPGGVSVIDEDWSAHVERLKSWTMARPQSITARVALAQTYVAWGWQARGASYAEKVTDQGWDQFGGRMEQAHRVLLEAAKLPEHCPFWYEAMQQVALAQGWDKPRARALLDQAVAFEPKFYHSYREYTNFLLPRWYGDDGEAEAFVNHVSKSVGGREGAFLYFELATVITCHCDSDREVMARLSWDKVKEGYAAMKQSYGTSDLKMNRFAYMAYLEGDQAAARPVFEQLGDRWEQAIWKSEARFEAARAWSSASTTQSQAVPPR